MIYAASLAAILLLTGLAWLMGFRSRPRLDEPMLRQATLSLPARPAWLAA